jgi:hypothetical protein
MGTITIPAIYCVGSVIEIKDINGLASVGTPLIIACSGSETIDGAASKTLTTAYSYIRLVKTNPTVWSIS